jgi:3-hydroxy acid dehydrogenase / malonic semialdehyde reductase
MSPHLHSKTILITGATSGIGRSTALEFARTCPQNLTLILTARRLSLLHEVAEEIKNEVGDGVSVRVVELDMCDAGAVRGFVESLERRDGGPGGVDVLVNNAYVLPIV